MNIQILDGEVNENTVIKKCEKLKNELSRLVNMRKGTRHQDKKEVV